ncbi:response regulator [Pleurocapsales cyanobacterium LEGE 10410]|nr:response regulator [Pleurocapsales cyanobacterium LEGE 10410]
MNIKPRRQKIQAANSQVPIILAVEDETDNLLLISHVLIFLKLNFITAADGKTAFDLATKYKIDLVLLDLLLPDTNGFELVRRLRENKLTKNVPIIAISGLAQDSDRDRALWVGCNDYLSKPYLIEDLKHKIDCYLPKNA